MSLLAFGTRQAQSLDLAGHDASYPRTQPRFACPIKRLSAPLGVPTARPGHNDELRYKSANLRTLGSVSELSAEAKKFPAIGQASCGRVACCAFVVLVLRHYAKGLGL
jgi:hypothetical protein